MLCSCCASYAADHSDVMTTRDSEALAATRQSMQRKASPASVLDRGPASATNGTHHYEYMYERWLAPYCHAKGLQIVETGAEHGKSLNMWDPYFTDAKLISGHGPWQQRRYEAVEQPEQGRRVSWGSVFPEAMQHLLQVGPWDTVLTARTFHNA